MANEGKILYTTIAKEAVAEFEEKRSIFICNVAPVKTEEEAMEFIKVVFLIKLLDINGFSAYMGACKKCRKAEELLYYDYKENVFLCDEIVLKYYYI